MVPSDDRLKTYRRRAPPRRTALHSFSLPPLAWKNQRLLRCVKIDSSSSPPKNPDDDDFREVRERLMAHYRTAVERIRKAGGKEEEKEDVARPWNLRTRRANAPSEVGRRPVVVMGRSEERRKLTVALTKEEIEEDLVLMLGTKPTKKPKKRPQKVQRALDLIFPGLWLADVEITTDTYKVTEDKK